MVDEIDKGRLRVDSSSVFLEFVGDIDSAGDGPSSKDLGFHLASSSDFSVLADLVNSIVLDSNTGWIRVSVIGWWGSKAVLADLDWRTGEFLWVDSLVVLAGLFWDTSLVGILVDSHWVSSITASSSIAVDDNLWGDGHLGERVVSEDIDSVSDGRGGSHGPAGTAVDGEMLVSGVAEVVGSSDVLPGELGWDVIGLEVFVGLGSSDDLLDSSVGQSLAVSDVDASWLLFPVKVLDLSGLLLQLFSLELFLVLWSVGDINIRRVVAPGVLWDGPVTFIFNSHVIGSSNKLEHTVNTPIGTPRVSTPPIFGSVLNSPTNNRDDVVTTISSSSVVVDTSSVVVSEIWG